MGQPWTHVVVGSFPVGDGLNETLFYRIDRRKQGYYVALRQWSPVKRSSAEVRQAKLRRLSAFRAAVEKVTTELRLDRPTTDNVGNQESEVFVIFLGDERNTPARVLERLPLHHSTWLSNLDAIG